MLPLPSQPHADPAAPGRPFVELPFWRTFPFRLALCLALAFALVITCVGVFAYSAIERSEMDNFRHRLHSLALSLSQSISPAEISAVLGEQGTESANYQSLYRSLRSVADQEKDIESIYILTKGKARGQLLFLLDASKLSRVAKRGEPYDATQVPMMLQGFLRVSVEESPVGDEFGQTLSAYAPVRDADGRAVAVLGVDVLSFNVEQLQSRVAALCIWLFGAVLLVTVLLSMWVGHQVRRPLSEVVHAATEIARGNLMLPDAPERSDEFGILARHFAEMASNLRDRERLRETFGLYISRELAESLLREGRVPALGGTECVATILFLDVQDFTRISETLSPTETIAMLNDYLGAMVEVIKQHRGCTLDFTGDGIITVFGAPFPQPDHARDAVNCALAMEKCMADLNEEWSRRGTAARWQSAGVERVQVRIGLHTGSLVAGNIGGATRMKYSVIGDTVNIAARLEAMNKTLGTSILMSEEVRCRLPKDLAARLVDRGVVPVRGRVHSVRVYAAR